MKKLMLLVVIVAATFDAKYAAAPPLKSNLGFRRPTPVSTPAASTAYLFVNAEFEAYPSDLYVASKILPEMSGTL